jgi:hypothetical protein
MKSIKSAEALESLHPMCQRAIHGQDALLDTLGECHL